MKSPRSYSTRRSAATRLAFRSILTVGTSLFIAASQANAAGVWIGGVGEYNDPTQWDNGVVPNAINTEVSNNGTINISQNETITTNDILSGTVATSVTSNWNQSTGSVTMGGGWFRMGTAIGASGTYNLSGGALTTVGEINIGEGNFRVQGVAGTGTTGTAGTSTFNMSGTGTWMNNGLQLTVGGQDNGGTGAGRGVLNQSGGTITNNNELWVGQNVGSIGTFNISGGTFNLNNWIAVARGGSSGTVNQTGGTINKTGGGNLTMVGGTTSATNVWNQTGGAFLTTGSTAGNGNSWFGEGGSATVNLSGGTFTTNNIEVGRGGAGAAVLNIQSATDTTPGLTNGGGTEVVTGLALTLGSGGTLTSTVNLNGGTLAVNNVVAGTGTGAKAFNFNGGLLQARAATSPFLGANIPANVLAGGARIDSNGNDLLLNSSLLHGGAAAIDGGLTKTGTGLLTLAGNNTYTGPTNVAGSMVFSNTGTQTLIGNITLTGATSGLTQTGTGITTLGGTNAYTGVTAVNAGTLTALTPGSLPGFETAGRVTVATGATLGLGYGGAGNFTSAQVDAARTTGNTGFAAGSFLGLDTTQATATSTYASNVADTAAGALGLAKLGANTLALTGTSTYSGGTLLRGGLLNFANLGNLGTGGITFNGGGLQYATGNTADISARAVVIQGGGGTVDTNGNNVTLANAITSTGALTKVGTGTLTITGGFGAATATNSGNMFIRQGAVTLNGTATTVNTGGNFSSIGQLPGDFGTLNVVNGATFTTTGDFNVADVGGGTATTPVNANNGGVLNIGGTGSAVTAPNIFIGKGGNATTNGALAVGVVNQTGGTFTGTGNTQVGVYGQGQYNLSAGTFNHTGGYISVARFGGSFGVVDVTGAGIINDTAAGTRTIIGEQGTGVLNVRNGGVVNANNSTTNNTGAGLTSALAALTIGNSAGTVAVPTLGIVNLLPGGTINTQSIGSVTGAAAGTVSSQLNFNGGTLKNTVVTATFIQNLTTANVFSGGAVVDTTAGNATIAQPLLAPAGQGVSAITATGTGFAATPIVQITGGGGTGATAIATIDGTGTVTGYTITNPGIGYTAAPTVTVTGPSGTVVTGTAAIGANVSGGLTKLGTNTLTLTGANTYTGTTNINAGTLALTGAGSIANSTLISTAAGATFSLGAATTFGATQTLTGQGTIQGTANALTISGTVSPGATNVVGTAGTLQIATTGALTLTGTAVYQFDIITAANKDLINATGAALTLAGTLTLRGTVDPTATYTLVSGYASETGTFATVTGTPAGYNPVFTNTGTNYNLSFVAVPEPSTWAMGVFGLGMAGLWLRRRRVTA